VSPRVRSEMSGSEEKIDGSDYYVREICAAKSYMLILIDGGREAAYPNPSSSQEYWAGVIILFTHIEQMERPVDQIYQ
jgi:hypothetical protein